MEGVGERSFITEGELFGLCLFFSARRRYVYMFDVYTPCYVFVLSVLGFVTSCDVVIGPDAHRSTAEGRAGMHRVQPRLPRHGRCHKKGLQVKREGGCMAAGWGGHVL